MTHEHQNTIDRRLRDALHATATADAELGASPEVHARLLADLRSRRRAGAPWRHSGWVVAAAVTVLTVTAVRWRVAQDTQVLPTGSPIVGADADVPGDFLPLPFANVPARSGHIVQMVVPAAVMASFGLEPSAAHGDVVAADVFVGDDGLARAVRFDISTRTEFTP